MTIRKVVLVFLIFYLLVVIVAPSSVDASPFDVPPIKTPPFDVPPDPPIKTPPFDVPPTHTLRELRVAFITDTHYATDDPYTTLDRLDKILSELSQQKITCLCITGDLLHDYTSESEALTLYKELRQRVQKYIPKDKILWVLGNHDFYGACSYEKIVDVLGMPNNYYHRDFTIKLDEKTVTVRFLVLDAQYTGDTTHRYNTVYDKGYVPSFQRTWLEDRLAEVDYAVVVCHQCFGVRDPPIERWKWLINYVQMESIMTTHKDKILYVLMGHAHEEYMVWRNGVFYFILGGLTENWRSLICTSQMATTIYIRNGEEQRTFKEPISLFNDLIVYPLSSKDD